MSSPKLHDQCFPKEDVSADAAESPTAMVDDTEDVAMETPETASVMRLVVKRIQDLYCLACCAICSGATRKAKNLLEYFCAEKSGERKMTG